MKKTFSPKKSAFSLIELSIVLIIIGLLIAGITGGASLIKSSELRSVMGEARGYAVAVNAFYTQYNAIPGDYNVAVGTTAFVGDNDAKIEYCDSTSGCTGASPFAGSESTVAWQQLKYAGAIDAAPTGVSAGTTAVRTAGTHNPASKIKASGWDFDYNTAAGSLQNVVVLTGTTTTIATTANSLVNGATVSIAALLPTDALSIDSKLDDGVASTGKVRAVNPNNGTGCAGGSVTVPSTVYTVATASKACALSYQVDVNS